jgi:hypothetical protein
MVYFSEKRGVRFMKSEEKGFILIIRPAIMPEERHEIEKCLKKLGYYVWGGGTNTDMSQCDIAFKKGR